MGGEGEGRNVVLEGTLGSTAGRRVFRHITMLASQRMAVGEGGQQLSALPWFIRLLVFLLKF